MYSLGFTDRVCTFALYYSYGTNKADVLHYSVDGLNNFGFRVGVSF